MDREMLRIFGGLGPFMTIPGYSPRSVQIELASEIMQIIKNGGVLIAEAGTGTGKSYAALVPAITAKKRTVIATATIALQEQYMDDVAKVKHVLGADDIHVVLLKGKGNFLCKEIAHNWGAIKTMNSDQRKVISELGTENNGDRSRLSFKISDRDWYKLSVSDGDADNCSGEDCLYFDECYYYRQRREALRANVVITNYHALFADKFYTGGKMLGGYDVLIADEGHRVPETAKNFFEQTISERQIRRIADKLGMGGITTKLLIIFQRQTTSMSAVINEPMPPEAFRGYRPILVELQCIGSDLQEELEDNGLPKNKRAELKGLLRRTEAMSKAFFNLTDESVTNYVRWFDENGNIKIRMFNVSETLKKFFGQVPSNILMSATMKTSGDFSFIKGETGLSDAKILSLKKVFDFDKQVKFYTPHPTDMPHPSEDRQAYIQATIDKMAEIIQIIGGRTLALFTSVDALRQAHLHLSAKFPNINFYVQGDLASQVLAERFKSDNSGVLLGTRTFFEGIDIPGKALSCVILDRFPFQQMGDPMVKEKKRREENTFYYKWYLPSALIVFKQAFGRLIRSKSDHGIFVLLDPRTETKYHRSIQQTMDCNLPILGWEDTKLELEQLSQGIDIHAQI